MNCISYLSKRGYVLKKEYFTEDELLELKKELRARPLSDDKFNKNEPKSFPIYVETKTKMYIPKMFGIKKFGYPESILENYNGQLWETPIEFNGKLFDRQIEPCDALYNACIEKGGGILEAGTGTGKCMKIDTDILMYDGTIKKVQDINVGELLMGDDSTPRKVLSLARGQDLMYDIIPVKGEKYTVNQEHILCLKISGKPSLTKIQYTSKTECWVVKWFENNKYNTKNFKLNEKHEAIKFMKNVKQQKIMEIAVKDYIKLSKHIKHILKGYKIPIEFPHIDVDLDPYMIGFWLGDGSSNTSEITNQDSTIIKYFKENLQQYKCYLQFKDDKTNKYTYRINGDGTKNYNSNHFLNTLKKYNLLNNKHIPMIYKCNSREKQLKLLAGLIDSDGSLDSNGCYDFIQKSEKLIDDIIYLVRSLGFACYKSKQKKGCWYLGEYKEDDYYRICISGNINEIPVLCPRKKANPRKQIKNVLVTGIKVKEVGYDNYYGFEIDGNRRYVIGDFTVTHNTLMCLNILSRLKCKAIIVVNKITLLNQWKSEIERFLPNASIGVLQGQKNVDIIDKDITVAMLQSLSRIDYPDELFKGISVTVFDECHNVSSENFSKILFKLCSKYTIGLSATPNRADGCEYVFNMHIGDIVYKSTVERKGKPPIIKCLKITSENYKEVFSTNKFTGQKTIQFTSMLSELIEMPKRNKLIIELIKNCIKEKRKILVLSDRRSHLVKLKELIDSDTTVTFTSGLFLGSMKIENLDKSKACEVILATFAAFSEGISVSQLDTLILTTPKKYIGHLKNTTKNESGKLEQIVGRIFRKKHIEQNPMILDLQDHFSVYKNQSTGRKKFYKEHFKNGIFVDQTVNLDIFTSFNSIVTKKTTHLETEDEQATNLITNFCLLDDE